VEEERGGEGRGGEGPGGEAGEVGEGRGDGEGAREEQEKVGGQVQLC
jgi:hypothetical protein